MIGLTYLGSSDEFIEQRQLHGIVEDASLAGIRIRLPNGTEFQLPPDLRGVEPAAAGVYTLRSTGEKVENPDFLCSWTINKPTL